VCITLYTRATFEAYLQTGNNENGFMTIKTQQLKILIVSVLLLNLLLYVSTSAYLYFDEGKEINLFNYAAIILVCFLTYRFFELGRHWLLIPIAYYLFIVGIGIIYTEAIINRSGNVDVPLIIGNFISSILLVAIFLYAYIKSLKRNTSSANHRNEP
jgi:hypothetical protein